MGTLIYGILSFHPSQRADEVKTCAKVSGGFLIACCDAPKVFDSIEEPLDKIAFSVEGVVTFASNLAVGLWWNHDRDPAHHKTLDEAVCVVAFVGQHCPWCDVGRKWFSLHDVMDLPFGQRYFQRIAKRVHNNMYLCRQPTS